MKLKILLSLVFLSIASVSIWGQDTITDLGAHSIPFTLEYRQEINKDDVQYSYTITLNEPGDLIISTCESTTQEVGVYLEDKDFNHVVDPSYEGDCDNPRLGKLIAPKLPAGTYTILLDWIGEGSIAMNIKGEQTSIFNTATDIGTFQESFVCPISHSDDNKEDNYNCYKLTLNRTMKLTFGISDESSPNTEVNVYNENKILSHTVSYNKWQSISLEAGTYFIVAESGALKNIVGDNGFLDGNWSEDKTYIVERTYLDCEGDTKRDKIIYYDEIGRPEETIFLNASPSNNNLASLMEYDSYGRLEKEWLKGESATTSPYYINTEELKEKIKSDYQGDQCPYSLTEYEQSPLNHVSRHYGEGDDWHKKDKALTIERLININNVASLDCNDYKIQQTDTTLTIKNMGSYASGTLTVTKQTDEDGCDSYDFKDSWGNTVLSRKVIGKDFYDTYRIYDEWGHIQAVLPPAASSNMKEYGGTWYSDSSDILRLYAYLYVYDERYRLKAKRIPGSDWILNIYDNADNVIFTQDGEQRQRGEWSFSLPDALGRRCIDGICHNIFTSSSLPNVIQVNRDNSEGILKGYVLSGITLFSPIVLRATYYDDYTFLGHHGMPSPDNLKSTENTHSYKEDLHGFKTGILSAILNGDKPDYLYSVIYYDYRGRQALKLESNALGGTDKVDMVYDYIGHPTKITHSHAVPGKTTLREEYTNTYDHAGRLLKTTHSLNGAMPVALTDNTYDDIGRLQTDKRNGHPSLKINYTYNVRSWLKKLESSLFSQTLYYNDKRPDGKNTPLYGGNISSMDWKENTDTSLKIYCFDYDNSFRLTRADYSEGSQNKGKFSVAYSYDYMGNILSLKRNGITALSDKGDVLNNMSMVYNGNQLISVDDTARNLTEKHQQRTRQFNYDHNGNMTMDLNHGISAITYNLLNIPDTICFANGRSIVMSHSVDGVKLRSVYKSQSTTDRKDYCGNVVYINGTAKLLLIPGGYISLSDGNYHFYVTDHEGNNRIVADTNGLIEEVNHYYPYGSLFFNSKPSIQSYKYNGKELESFNNLNWYDYGARMYDAYAGHWMVPDPLAEHHYDESPYGYCAGNPVNRTDLWGLDHWVLYRQLNQSDNLITQITNQLANGVELKKIFKGWKFISNEEFNSLSGIDYSVVNYNDITQKLYMTGNVERDDNGYVVYGRVISFGSRIVENTAFATWAFDEVNSIKKEIINYAIRTDNDMSLRDYHYLNGKAKAALQGAALSKYMKVIEGFELAALFVGAYDVGTKIFADWKQERRASAISRGVIWAATVFPSAFPCGFYISTAISLWEMKYGEQFYNYVQQKSNSK